MDEKRSNEAVIAHSQKGLRPWQTPAIESLTIADLTRGKGMAVADGPTTQSSPTS